MTRQEVSQLLAHYDLGELRSFRRVGHGYVNDNWVVETTTGEYFLKRRHPTLRQPRRIGAQHALIHYLRAVRFPAPAIISTRYGNTFVELQGEICETHSYIAGTLCDVERPAHVAAAARMLGRYHTSVQGFDHVELHRPGQRYGPHVLREIVHRMTEDWQGRMPAAVAQQLSELQAHTDDLARQFDDFGRLPELVIHGDFYAENLIFQEDVVAGVVDYDRARWGWRAMELAEALIYFAVERPARLKHIVYPGVLDLRAARRFLVAYSEGAQLAETEIRALPHLMGAIWLCAALDPPLGPPLGLKEAPQALPEVLELAGWAQVRAAEIVAIGRAARARGA